MFTGCRQDSEGESTITSPIPDPEIIENYNPKDTPITSSVIGEVISERGNDPVVNATVKLGNRTTTTNEYGLFEFQNVTMNQEGTFITVTKADFLDGSRRFFPRADVTSKVVVELITKISRPAFQATAGGTVTVDDVASVTFPPNSIVNAEGEVFDGEVHVASAYLDPTASTTANRMPGNLQGVTTDLEEVVLTTFGMINVNLEDSNGNPLNIREGFTATITLPIPAQLTTAPNEIPLWSFNETYGVWAEDGQATNINGNYVGEVSHFSWWNCDVPSNFINLDLTLVDQNDIALEYYQVGLAFATDSSACYYSYTSSEGFVSGAVPKDQELLLVIRGICGETVYSTTIGPFADDTSLGDLVITGSEVNNTQILGRLVDCNGDAITNGGLIIRIGAYEYIRSIENGDFDIYVSSCDGTTDLEVIGLDFDAALESDPVTGQAGTTVNTGDISVCDNPITESILTLNVGSETYTYFGSFLTGQVNPTNIFINYVPQDSLNGETYLSFNIFGSTPGNYDNNNGVQLYDDEKPFNLTELNPNTQQVQLENMTISQTSPNIVGSFSDTLVNTLGVIPDTVLVSGNFTIIQ